jgi:hypothetical protein
MLCCGELLKRRSQGALTSEDSCPIPDASGKKASDKASTVKKDYPGKKKPSGPSKYLTIGKDMFIFIYKGQQF